MFTPHKADESANILINVVERVGAVVIPRIVIVTVAVHTHPGDIATEPK
jgi:hypothetical protein